MVKCMSVYVQDSKYLSGVYFYLVANIVKQLLFNLKLRVRSCYFKRGMISI